MKFFLAPGLECFDISFHKTNNMSSWEFGSCSSSPEFSTAGIYIDKCCISPGEHILTCKKTDGHDWSRSVLTLKGHQFCNDYVGSKTMITLNLEGTITSRKTYTHT